MNYIRIAPDIDCDPDIEEAGWCAARVYELLLKVSGLKDLRGTIPPEFQRPAWLARRWNLTADDLPGVSPEDFIANGLRRLLNVGKVALQDGNLVIIGWAKFYAPKDSSTPRVQRHRGVKRDETHETDVTVQPFHSVSRNSETDETAETLPTHPLHTTPPTSLHTTTTSTKAAAVDLKSVPLGELPQTHLGFWEFMRRERESAGLPPESRPRGFVEWYAEAIVAAPVGDLCDAYGAFLRDDWARGKGNAPAGLWVKDGVWRSRLPAEPARKAGRL